MPATRSSRSINTSIRVEVRVCISRILGSKGPIFNDTCDELARKLSPKMDTRSLGDPATALGGDNNDRNGGRTMFTAPDVKLVGSGFPEVSKIWLDRLKFIGVGAARAVADAVKVIVRRC